MLICITQNKEDTHIFAYTFLWLLSRKKYCYVKNSSLWLILELSGLQELSIVRWNIRLVPYESNGIIYCSLEYKQKNLQNICRFLSFVARRGIEPLFQEWKSCVLTPRRTGRFLFRCANIEIFINLSKFLSFFYSFFLK